MSDESQRSPDLNEVELERLLTAAPLPGFGPGANMLDLLKAVNGALAKLELPRLTAAAMDLPRWKQWVEGTGAFDTVGLRDILRTYGVMLNGMKPTLDALAQSVIDLRAEVEALKEAPPARPFP